MSILNVAVVAAVIAFYVWALMLTFDVIERKLGVSALEAVALVVVVSLIFGRWDR